MPSEQASTGLPESVTDFLPQSLEGWLDYISQQHSVEIEMGLGRVRGVADALELLTPDFQVVTVAGTNGKGSTCCALEAMCLAHGRRVGATLSPHIRQFNERIRLNGADASDADLCLAFAAVEAARGPTPLTYFEYSTLAALWLFRHWQVEVAILEIGLGGRLDAFNIIDADVGVITSIGLDHQEFLGDTLEAIGAEKAGILRPGQAVVLGPDMPDSVMARCRRVGVVPLVYGRQVQVRADVCQVKDLLISVDWSGASLPRQNIAVALAAWLALQGPAGEGANVEGQSQLLSHAEAMLRAGCDASLPGRLQAVVARQRTWLLDVAHNPAGAEFLTRELKLRGISCQAVVCGMFLNKPHAEFVEVLRAGAGLAPEAWFLCPTSGPRQMDAVTFADRAGLESAAKFETISDAIDAARSATSADDVILVCGSFSVLENLPADLQNQR